MAYQVTRVVLRCEEAQETEKLGSIEFFYQNIYYPSIIKILPNEIIVTKSWEIFHIKLKLYSYIHTT